MKRLHWITFVAACLVIYLLCFIPLRAETENVHYGRLMDAGHLPLFGLLALGVLTALWLKNPQAPHWKLSIRTAVISLFVAALVEVLQPLVSRDASYSDFIFGAIGIVLALGLSHVVFGRWNLVSFVSILIALTCGTIIVLTPIFELENAEKSRRENFPLLANFESSADLLFWHPIHSGGTQKTKLTRESAVIHDGQYSLRVELGNGSWPGVAFTAPTMSWNSYDLLELSIHVAEAGPVFIRIDDNGVVTNVTDRYNQRFELNAGWNSLTIPISSVRRGPKNRTLNMSRIRRMLIFVNRNPADSNSRQFFVDSVQLVKVPTEETETE